MRHHGKPLLQSTFQKFCERIIDHPWWSLLAVLLITALAGIGHYDASLLMFWSREAPVGPPREVSSDEPPPQIPNVEEFELDSDAVIVVQCDDFFTPDAADAIRQVVESIQDLDYVARVTWIERAPPLNIFGLREPIFPRSGSSPQRFAAARQRAMNHPLIVGGLLSPDGKTMLLLIQFEWLFITDDSDCTTGLKQTAEQAVAEFPTADMSFQITGRVPLELAVTRQNQRDAFKYQLIAYGFTLLMAVILFRGLIAVVVVSIAPGLGMLWTLGMVHYFDLQDNPFNHVVLPILISLVGFTDGVHMMVQIRSNRAAGHSPREAARIALREVGLACALTSLTTAIGFGSLSLAHHHVVREFGWSCVIGVILTFFSVITVIPLLCLTPLGRRIHAGHSRGLIDQHFGRAVGIVNYVLRYHRAVSWIGILVLLMLIVISMRLRPDERITTALPAGGEGARALHHMDKAFGGLERGRVEVHWNKEIASDAPEVLKVLREVDAVLSGEPLIGHPLSIGDLIDALPGEGDAAERVGLLDLLPPPLKREFYEPEVRLAHVQFRVQDLGIATYGPVFERIEGRCEEIVARHPQFHIELRGTAVWRWRNLYQIVVDLATSLGTATVIIFFVMSFAYRSLRLGLISLVPNILPLAATGTLLVMMGQSLEIVSVCAFTVCLGIAVDDTIHFLTRYQEERKKTNDPKEAIRRAFVHVGTALIMTTMVLVGGFSTAFLSDTRDHRIFCGMGILTITSALFADLILLPAMLTYFRGRDTSANEPHITASPDNESPAKRYSDRDPSIPPDAADEPQC